MKKLIVGSGVAAGVVVVGVLAGYWHFAGLLPERQVFAEGSAPEETAQPEPGPSVASEAEAPPAPETAEAEPDEPDAGAPAPDASRTADAPSFELLRVEPDGSAVIAGRAAPGSEVKLLSGGEVIASERASEAGDFAMALTDPLAVGEHELTLQTEDEAGEATESAEAAIVSVPETGREEELLVALGAPNEPTRILQRPALAEAAAPSSEPAAAPDANEPEAPAAEAAATAAQEIDRPAGSALSIAAVEIERDRIYVAGTTRPGGRVRVYVDDEFLAEGQGTGEEFIAEGRAEVSVGSHRVRADEIGPDGSVVARVEVPFDRPEGESMAALAPGIRGAAPAQEREARAAETEAAAVGQPPADPEPTSEAPSTSDAEPTPTAPSTANVASETPDAPELAAASGNAEAPAVDVASVQPDAARPAEAAVAAFEPAPEAPSRGAVDEGASAAEGLRTQAALEPVDGRVIIRRGDTLWRISRDTYGLGRRYTVIYLANGDQIRDPDLIYPGQVFRLPEETDGETSELR